jgi:hypothetical protein
LPFLSGQIWALLFEAAPRFRFSIISFIDFVLTMSPSKYSSLFPEKCLFLLLSACQHEDSYKAGFPLANFVARIGFFRGEIVRANSSLFSTAKCGKYKTNGGIN